MPGVFKFGLVTAPLQVDTGADGVIDRRRVRPHLGLKVDQTIECNLGDTPPEIPAIKSGLGAVSIRRGGARTFRLEEDLVKIRLRMDEMDSAEIRKLHLMLSQGKPVAFTPWYGPTTHFMTTFGRVGPNNGIGEVGYNGSDTLALRYSPSDPDGQDFAPSRWNGEDGWLTQMEKDDLLKLVPGMAGHAALIESKTENVFPSRTMTWLDNSNAISRLVDHSNNPESEGHECYVPDDGSYIYTEDAPALSAALKYTVSFWIRGSGNIKVHAEFSASSITGPPITLDPQKWIRAVLTFQQTGTTLDVRILADGGDALFCICAGQIEALSHPTSWMNPQFTAPTVSDKVHVNELIPRGGGLTIVMWVKRWLRSSGDADRRYFFSAYQSADGNNFYAYGQGDTFHWNILNSAESFTIPSGSFWVEGTWAQFVFRINFDGGAAGIGADVWLDGSKVDEMSNATPTTALLSEFTDGIVIGSDFGLSAMLGRAIDTPIDRFRLDAHAWTQQEIEDDYAMLSDEGIRTFLTQTQGRYFRIVNSPSAFLAGGSFTDAMEGDIILDQISHAPEGIPA